jgi:hypothetical protein
MPGNCFLALGLAEAFKKAHPALVGVERAHTIDEVPESRRDESLVGAPQRPE